MLFKGFVLTFNYCLFVLRKDLIIILFLRNFISTRAQLYMGRK